MERGRATFPRCLIGVEEEVSGRKIAFLETPAPVIQRCVFLIDRRILFSDVDSSFEAMGRIE
jgi:hypothetical protein